MATYAISNPVQALAASTPKTLLLVAAGSTPHRLAELHLCLDGQAAGVAVGVELYRTTTLGAPAGTAVTPVRDNTQAYSAAATALANLTTEPTATEVLRSWFVTPFGGMLIVPFLLGREPMVQTSATRLGLRVVPPATVAANARATLLIDE